MIILVGICVLGSVPLGLLESSGEWFQVTLEMKKDRVLRIGDPLGTGVSEHPKIFCREPLRI